MKRCCYCKEFKTQSEFYKNQSCKDGLSYRCKMCESKRDILRSEYKTAQNKKPEHIVQQREGWKRWYQKNKEQYNANWELGYAVRNDGLLKQVCDKCGEIKTEGHHFDYKKALEVVWLCKSHHEDLHHPLRRELNRIGGTPSLRT